MDHSRNNSGVVIYLNNDNNNNDDGEGGGGGQSANHLRPHAVEGARTLFIRHQPSQLRNVVAVYRRVDLVQSSSPVAVLDPSSVAAKQAPVTSSVDHFAYGCSKCDERFRNAFSLLKHLNKNHYHRPTATSSSDLHQTKEAGSSNAQQQLRHLRSLTVPSGRILLTLLSKTALQNKQQRQLVQQSNEEAENIETNRSNEKQDTQTSYHCRFCTSVFPYRSLLYLHYRFHRRLSLAKNSHKLICGVCTRLFVNRSALFVHIRSRHPANGLSCDMTASFPASCCVCFKRFQTEPEREAHETAAHLERRLYPCDQCSPAKTFRTLRELDIHRKWHKKEKRFECSVCHRMLSTKGNLARHLVIKHGTDEDKARLAEKSKFSKQAAMPLVEEDQLLPPPKHDDRVIFDNLIECSVCCRRFATFEKLTEHRRLRHSDGSDLPWPYACTLCKFRFQFPSQLIHHKKTAKDHLPAVGRLLKRHQVPRLVAAASARKSRPPDPVPFVNLSAVEPISCFSATTNMEPPQPPTATSLFANVDLAPAGDAWMAPLLANTRLSEEPSFLRLEAATSQDDAILGVELAENNAQPEEEEEEEPEVVCVRNGNGTFTCSSCSKVFSRFADGNRHVRVVHSQSKPFTCEVCDRTFKWRHSYVDHVRTHRGERPYVCEFCKASFTASGNLVRHRKHSHPKA